MNLRVSRTVSIHLPSVGDKVIRSKRKSRECRVLESNITTRVTGHEDKGNGTHSISVRQ